MTSRVDAGEGEGLSTKIIHQVNRRPVLLAVCFRLAVALLSFTYFQPDEYFQALEPAHKLVFGYGHLTWEWRAHPPIRGIGYPMLFAPIYWILSHSGLDTGPLIIIFPKLVQGLFASITDVAIRRLARNVYGDRYVSTAFFLSITSIFHVQALSRTLSNSLETSLTTAALAEWPFGSSRTPIMRPLLVAAVTCMIRPTNFIIWVFLIFELSWRMRSELTRLFHVWLHVCIIGTTACTLLVLLDSWYYGFLTFTPLNFLKTNLTNVSTFYGHNPWHYYISQALPVLCNVTVIFVLQGIWKGARSSNSSAQRLVALVLWTLGIYSITAHKEWRFIHPLLPVMHVFASKPIVDFYTKKPGSPRRRLSRIPKMSLTLIIWPFILAIPYILFIQSRAQIAVMHHLRSIPDSHLQSVGFLMPCHSTPWQSYLHRPHLADGLLWALGCEPPLEGQNIHTYRDQTDIFYNSPLDYLQTRFPTAVDPSFPPSPHPTSIPGIPESESHPWEHSWPSHIVLFGSLLEIEGVRNHFESLGYRQEWHGWNGLEQDGRRRGGVRIWNWRNQAL